MLVEYHIYIHIRHIMLYHYEKGWKVGQSFRDLTELFDEGTISEWQCREWFARFKSVLEDNPGRGRPSDFDNQALIVAVEEDESLRTRMLAETSTSTTQRSCIVLKNSERYGNWLDGPSRTI